MDPVNQFFLIRVKQHYRQVPVPLNPGHSAVSCPVTGTVLTAEKPFTRMIHIKDCRFFLSKDHMHQMLLVAVAEGLKLTHTGRQILAGAVKIHRHLADALAVR